MRSFFSKAQPFLGNCAAVGDKRGWTLINTEGKTLTYPNFSAITPIHSSLFQTGKLSLYGLFDATGKLLIPVHYEQLNFLPHGIIQAVSNGEVTYFRKDGKPLF